MSAVAACSAVLTTPGLPDSAILLASAALGNGLGLIGRADELDAVMTSGYTAAARSLEATFMRYPLAQTHASGLYRAGYIARAVRVAQDFHAASGDLPGTSHLYGVAVLGPARLASGQLEAAIDLLREVCATGGSAAPTAMRYGCLINLTVALAMSGDAAEARAVLADAETGRHPAFVMLDPELVLARAWVAAAEGAVSEALATARQAATMATELGHLAQEVLMLQAAVCFGDRTVAERLAELATTVDGPRVPAAAAHAAALAAGNGDALMAASQAYERMGDLVAAADAAAQAATAHSTQARRGSAASAAARAHRIAQACAASTPALTAAAQPLPLTEREREIVTLAADGLSNREIADRLVVSARTVEGHLYWASTKLGVTSRGQLAALLGTE
jgi:DNA-binding NarL/FixJ family response regulator